MLDPTVVEMNLSPLLQDDVSGEAPPAIPLATLQSVQSTQETPPATLQSVQTTQEPPSAIPLATLQPVQTTPMDVGGGNSVNITLFTDMLVIAE